MQNAIGFLFISVGVYSVGFFVVCLMMMLRVSYCLLGCLVEHLFLVKGVMLFQDSVGCLYVVLFCDTAASDVGFVHVGLRCMVLADLDCLVSELRQVSG